MYSLKNKTVTALLVAALSGLSGCGTQTTTTVPQILKKAEQAPIADPFAALQEAADKYLKLNKPMTMSAQEVYEKAVAGGNQNYYLVDVRSDEHYAGAHIPGAIHIAYNDTWREEKIAHLPKDRKIVVVDYSGHAASQVSVLWSMLGFDTIVMQNGMAGWSKNKEVIGGSPMPCEPQNYPLTNVPSKPTLYDLPQLEIKVATLPNLIRQQSRLATEKPVVVQAQDMRDKLSHFYIVDLRSAEHYQAGHIEGAVHIPFRQLAQPENLRKLPADKQIVFICYDGHAASQAARIVNQLGYNAMAMRDGMSVWTGDEKASGIKTIACANIQEHPFVRLNAVLKAGPAAAAT